MTLRLAQRITLFFSLMSVVLLSAVGWLAYRSGSEGLKAAAISELLAKAIEKEAALDTWIDERSYILREISDHADIIEKTAALVDAVPGSATARSAHAALLGALDPHVDSSNVFSGLFVVDARSGKVLASTDPAEVGKSKISHPYFDHGKSGLYLQMPYYSEDLHAALMTAALPLRAAEGRVVAVLAGRLDLNALGTIVQRRTGLHQSDEAFLINAERYPLTQPRFIDAPVVLQRLLDSASVHHCAARNSGVILAADYRGVPSISVCRWNAKRQFGLIVKIDQAEALAPAYDFGRSLLWISGLALLIVAGVAVWLTRNITHPLRSLQASVRKLSETHSSGPLPKTAGDELVVLAHEFKQMSMRVEQRTAELERERSRLAAILQTGSDGLVILDPAGVVVEANTAFLNMLGYDRTAIGHLRVFDIEAQMDKAVIEANIQKVFARREPMTFETRNRCVDGRIIDVELNVRAITIAGRDFIYVSSRDRTQRIQARRELEFKNMLLAAQQEASPDGILVVDAQAKILHYNLGFVTLWNLPPALVAAGDDEPVLRHVVDQQADPAAFLARVKFLYEHRAQKSQEVLVLADGRSVDRYSAPMFAADGSYCGRVWYFRDITERKQSEQKLRLTSEALANIAEGVLIADANSKIVFANKAFVETSGYMLEETLGHTPSFLHSGRQNTAFYKAMWEQLLATGHWQGEVWDRHKNGSIYPILLSLSAMRNHDGSTHYVAVLRDISKSKRYEAELEQQAHHDALTQLPNRTLFRLRLDAALTRARSGGTRLSLLFLDLDRFKIINDTLGHPVGDELLRHVSARLERCVRDTDTVARFGGDEFAILLDLLAAKDIVAKLAQKILDTLAEVFVINDNELYISASIGITTFPDDGADIQTLFKNADSAMYEAKAAGRNAYRFFASSGLGTHALEKLRLGNDLRHAIARNELHLEYQPRLDLKTGKVQGFEALTRWRHPVHGLIPPDKFIPIAEQTGQIEIIGDWVLHEACRQLYAWRDRGLVPQRVAINLSGLQFARADLPGQIAAILKECGIEPSLLELELTESVIMADAERSTRALAELRAMGLLIAIDDFGTGYSSLNYLKRFPVSYLKIDKSFVAGVCDNSDDAAITRAIIALAKSLGLKLIAEGVETEGQRAFLEREACDEAQGFLFSRPLPAEQAAALLACVEQAEPVLQ